MSLHPLSASQAMAQLATFDAVIDARSELEFAEDHLPGAQNWPSLNNEERVRVGTLYKQVSPFEAQKLGAALVAANIARHIQTHVLELPKNWRPLIYCWRGGKRSHSLALVLGQIGFKVHLLEGGYKAFRTQLLADLPRQATALRYQVVCGPTGSGKTRLLHALAQLGAQVLDLEALACHRSSVLGALPGLSQPGQKHFETLLWQTLRSFDPARPVYVEAESRKVGNLRMPEALMERLRHSPCTDLQLPLEERIDLLLEDYPWFRTDPELLCARLEVLTELRGKQQIQTWQQAVRSGAVRDVVRGLLAQHYDPRYGQSMQRQFLAYATAHTLVVPNRSPLSLKAAATELLKNHPIQGNPEASA